MEPAAVLSILLTARGVQETNLQLRKVNAQAERTAASTEKLEKRFSNLDNTVGDFNRTMLGLRNVVGIIKWPAMIAGAGAAAQAVGALSAGAIGLASALAPLAGLGAAGAAGFVALGQGLGVAKLAFAGIGKALNGNKKALQGLTPAQRDFVKSLKDARGKLKDLQNTAAAGLLPGLGAALKNVMPLFGELKTIVRDTAHELGSLAQQASASVRTWGPDLAKVGKTNIGVLHNLGEAAISFADAAKNIVVVAGSLLTWITKMIQAGADWVDIQVQAGRESGRLAAFLGQTRDVMKRLWEIGKNLFTVIYNIGRAAAPLGRALLGSLQGVTKKWADWTGSLTGQNQLRKYFDNAKPSIDALATLVGQVAAAVVAISSGPGLPGLVTKIGTVIPGLQSLVSNTAAALGPALVDALANIVGLLSTLGGTSGPLTLTVQTIGFLAGVLRDLLSHNSALNAMVVGMLGLGGALKILVFFLSPAAKGVALLGGALVALSGATSGATLATILLSAAMDALPFIAIGVAIAALIGGMILLYTHVKVARDIMNAAWAQIKAVAMNVFGGLKDFFAGWIKIIVGFVQVFKGVFTLHFGEAWDGVKKIFTGAIQAVLGYMRALAAPVLVAMKAVGKAIHDPIADAWTTLKKVVSDAIAWILNRFADMLQGFADVLKAMAKVPVIGKAFKGVADEVQGAADKIHGLATSIKELPPKVGTQVDVKVNFLSNLPGAISSIGATISNIGAKVGGASAVAGIGHRAVGGMVDQPMIMVGEEAPKHPEVILATNPAYRQRNLGLFAQAGQMLGVPGFAQGGIATAGKMVSQIDPWTAQHADTWMAGKAKSWANTKFSGGGAGGGGPSGAASGPVPGGSVRDWLTKALQITNHFSPSNLSALYGRTIQESGGNPRNINLWDSNAKAGHPSKGLLQTIDSTFATYHLPGYNDIWNPIDNAIAAIRYMYARYGHIVGASSSGYAKGGILGKARGFASGGINWSKFIPKGITLPGSSAAKPTGGGGGSRGGLPSAGSILGLPSLPSVLGASSVPGQIQGSISSNRAQIAGLEQAFNSIDSYYSLSGGASFVDPNTGLRDEKAIAARVAQLNVLIAYRQRIFKLWGFVVAMTQRLIAANATMIRGFQAYLGSISTKGLKGNALKTAQKHIADAKTAIAKYTGNNASARGDLTTAIGDRQSAWISLQSLLGEKFSIAGTVSQVASTVADNTGGGTLDNSPVTDTGTIQALQTLLTQANQRTAVSQAQYSVLSNLPFGGSFAQGGVVPGPLGAPSVIIAHGGEPVGMQTPQVSIHFASGMEWLGQFVDVRVSQAGRSTSRTSRRALPGSTGR